MDSKIRPHDLPVEIPWGIIIKYTYTRRCMHTSCKYLIYAYMINYVYVCMYRYGRKLVAASPGANFWPEDSGVEATDILESFSMTEF